MLNEIEENLEKVTKKLLGSFNKALIIIEAGTPHGFNIIKKIRNLAIQNGYNIFAPCSWAMRASSLTGFIVPSTLLTCATLTNFVRSVKRFL